MPSFNNLTELQGYLVNVITDVIKNEVADAVRKEWISIMEKNVYDAYQPFQYQRRGSQGGLADPKNIQIVNKKVAKDNALFVLENMTKGNGWDDFAGKLINSMIESESGFAGNPKTGMPARPFTEEAYAFMTTGIGRNTILQALNDGLVRRGIQVKM